jgi:hypothetical protein
MFWGLSRTYGRGYRMPPLPGLQSGGVFVDFSVAVRGPQGLKPTSFLTIYGTTEVVPFPSFPVPCHPYPQQFCFQAAFLGLSFSNPS